MSAFGKDRFSDLAEKILGKRLETKDKVVLVIAVLVIGFVVLGVGYYLFPTPSNQGYDPEQPIPFSHKKHAGLYKIDCKYCHSQADKSIHAGIPSLNVCMNCHSVVKTESPYIQQIQKHYREGKPIEWIRVHELQDFVRFNHSRHVAKGVRCETCHGNVKEMDRIYQKEPLTMGWCLSCHRGQTTPQYLLQQVYPGEQNPHGPVAPFNCSTCHY